MSSTTVRKSTVVCGACGTKNRIPLVGLVDADRRRDQRQAIMERMLQSVPCSECGASVRSEPEMVYFERSRDLWITAYPREQLAAWPEWEAQADSSFDAYHRSESEIASRMGQATLHRRVTFGWEALREKLLLSGSGLDDVTAELCKLSLIQRGRYSRPDETAELRFCDIRAKECTIATFLPSTDEPANPLRVPRELFNEVGTNVDDWRAARVELSTGTFVDLKRLKTEAA